MSVSKPTPMIQQYLSIKEEYADAVLFYRMGDFYEMFFEDAVLAAKALEITLTSRNKNDSVPVPMCGVPYRAAQGYIARLVEKGHKVAICDQVEDPATAKGLVRREVVRVVTPGMIVENELLQADSHNYLLALCCVSDVWGLSYLDISTGHFRLTQAHQLSKITDEVLRIGPKEILLPATLESDSLINRLTSFMGHMAVNVREDEIFEFQRSAQQLTQQFHTRSLEGFGCQQLKAGVGAAGALMTYVQETQKQAIVHLRRIESYSLEDYLIIDHQSRLNLELEKNLRNNTRQGTLIHILDKTMTAMGSRQIRLWLRYPLLAPNKIGQRLDAVQEAVVQSAIRHRIRDALSDIYDIERLHSKIVMGQANARDLLTLGRSLAILPNLLSELTVLRSDLFQCPIALDGLEALSQLIATAIRDDAPAVINEGGMINGGFDPQLDELISISRDAKGYLAQLEVKEKSNSGISSLKVRYNKVFGYYIEVPKTHSERVPDHYVRKQTLVNAERYITDELKQFETKVFTAEEKRSALELDIFHSIQGQVKDKSTDLTVIAGFLATLDSLTALSELADISDYCRPSINTEGLIRIVDGRHPVVEKLISGERFVPNTITLDNQEQQVLIITGPNMAGKSTVLRQVALSVIMAQMGSFVPAGEADIAVVDRVFTRVGALDNLSAGQSTFMVEMEETANILNNATAQSLVIMDEIGRGTSTYDGLSIAWAVAEYLHNFNQMGVKTLFATHYHELTVLADTMPRVKNYNIAVKEWQDQIIFLRKLIPGGTNRSYGIQVAKLAGLPEEVIEASKKILESIESKAPVSDKMSGEYHLGRGDQHTPVQLDLFGPMESNILDRLRSIDLNHTTPMEAFQFLQDLNAKLKKREH